MAHNKPPLTDEQVAEMLLQDDTAPVLSGNYHDREWTKLSDDERHDLVAMVKFIRSRAP